MEVLAHQRYTELLDTDVYLETLQFNSRAHYALLPGLLPAVYLTPLSDSELARLVYTDISISGGSRRIPVIRSSEQATAYRKASASRFVMDRGISYGQIDGIAGAALMRQPSHDGLARMPYPSGGALYSVQAIVCRTSESLEGWPSPESQALQVLAQSRVFEPLDVDARPAELLQVLSGGLQESLGEPSFAIVYAMFLDKALFKYRYRGYRLAMLEAGSMYQRVTQEVDARGLATRVWAGFSDWHVASILGLDASHVLPLVVQFVGSKA